MAVLTTFPERLRSLRGPGESFSDVILKLAGNVDGIARYGRFRK
jgi:hypothetical protein